MNNKEKKNVWRHIVSLIIPYKKRLFSVFLISMLGTGVTLIEPLVYREAINDVAGLFVQQARNDVRNEMGVDTEDDSSPTIPFFDKLMNKTAQPQLITDTIGYSYDTIRIVKDTTILARVKVAKGKHHKAEEKTIKKNQKVVQTKVVKQPHTKTRVAPRTPSQAFKTLLWAVIILFIINMLGLLFWWIAENMNVRLSSTIERNFIQNTFRHVLKLPLSFFAKRSSAALHKQIDQSEEISGTITYFTKDIFPEVVSLVGIIAIMLWQNYIMALMAFAVIPFYLWITLISTRKLEMSLAGYYEKWEDVSARMQDALSGIKTVKLSGAEDREVNRLDKQTSDAYKDYMQRSFLSNKYAFWQVLLTHLSTAMVLTYGGYLALHHQLTPGDVVMFVAYLDMLYSPIDNLASIWAEVQQNVTSVARAFRLLDNNVEEKSGKQLQALKGKVEFRNVQFGYQANRIVLPNLSFTAEPGKITAFVGSSGAGKTTTVDLLLKLYEPQHGEILIDGNKLSEADASSIREFVGMVTADGAVFRGSLADNIRYKKPDVSDEEVKAAALAAGLQATLERLPEGLQTIVGESGIGLSVGERQRIQIARVIAAKPKILILDEATANLDYATEAEIKRTIEVLRKESTILIIAHRYAMVKDADHIIVLDSGEIIEEGSPAELLEQNGWFAAFATAGEEEEEEIGEDEEESDEEVEDDEGFEEDSDEDENEDEHTDQY